MSVDKLQEKIRKVKNPSVVDMTVAKNHIPAHLLQEQGSYVKAYERFCQEILEGLKGIVPAVRFSLGAFSLLGGDGLEVLSKLLAKAKTLGYYVIMDIPEATSALDAQRTADLIAEQDSQWPCDGLLLSAYIGSDGIKPFLPMLKETGKDLFVLLRTSNKSAPELQDLMTGGRLVHVALADLLSRHGAAMIGRSGYSQLAGVGAASSADALRNLRGKYKNLFLLLDGYDYPNANAKNCSFAFDRLGHGAAACAGLSITAAWQTEETEGLDYVEAAQRAADRMKKNLTRYVTIL